MIVWFKILRTMRGITYNWYIYESYEFDSVTAKILISDLEEIIKEDAHLL